MEVMNNTAKLVAGEIKDSFENESEYNHASKVAVDEDLKSLNDTVLLIMLVVIMLSMGCEITWNQLLAHIRRPVGLSIGVISQFAIKPLISFGVLLMAGIDGLHATGVLIIACCPGGVLSNTFTYFIDGDLPLSVAMTTGSTIIAMGMLPANLWLYGRSFESISLVIPYGSMTLSLAIVTSPIVVGMLFKWKFPRVAKWVTKIGMYSGLLLMLICVVIEVCIFPNMFTRVPLKVYAIILSLPFIGLSLGYVIAALFKQSVPVCKTIAIECGIQNFPLALTIIALSFSVQMQEELVFLPLLYGVSMVVLCSFFVGIYVASKKLKNSKKELKEFDLQKNLDEGKKEFTSHNTQVQMVCPEKMNGQIGV